MHLGDELHRREGVSTLAHTRIAASNALGDAPHRREDSYTQDSKDFYRQARRTKTRAFISGVLHKGSRIAGFCALKWATAVRLGGFASAMQRWDFIVVSILVIFEVLRFLSIEFSFELILGDLYCEHSLPEEFEFADKQSSRGTVLVFLGQILSLVLALVSLGLSTLFLWKELSQQLSEHTENTSNNDVGNLPISLRIFYSLAIFNSGLSVISSFFFAIYRGPFRELGYHMAKMLKCHSGASVQMMPRRSLDAFYDAIYRAVTEQGLAEALRLKIEEFAFDKIGGDLKRRIRPVVVGKTHMDMIQYLYRQGEGVAMAYQYLRDGGDVWRQVAAANLPGFWAKQENIKLQVALFWRLRERIYGPGWDAESALNSVQRLAREWAKSTESQAYATHPFLVKDPFTNGNVVDSLIELLLHQIRPTLLYQVRAFEACSRDIQIRSYLYKNHSEDPDADVATTRYQLQQVILEGNGSSTLERLCVKLCNIVNTDDRIWIITRIYAMKALLCLLLHEGGSLSANTSQRLREIVEKNIVPFRLPDSTQPPKILVDDVQATEIVCSCVGIQFGTVKWSFVNVIDVNSPDKRLEPARVEKFAREAYCEHVL